MKRLIISLLLSLTAGFLFSTTIAAQEATTPSKTFGLKVAPLEYRTSLKAGEDRKGFVDVSNPTNETLLVTTSVQAFRQADNGGRLEFFDNEQVAAGIQLDLDSFDLPPRSALRMYFLLKSDQLPTGDVFASIFFTTKQEAADTLAVYSAVRVGTLLSIVNKTPGSREAEITDLSVSPVQWGTANGSYRIKNTARPSTVTGFYPEVNLSLQPFGQSSTMTASLLFAGRERSNTFSLNGFGGVQQVTVSYKGSQKIAYVLLLTPLFVAIAACCLLVLAVFVMLLVRRLRRRRTRRRAPRKR